MIHREKFCVVYSDIFDRTNAQPKWLFYDEGWEELLLLPVNAKWLRKTVSALSVEDLTKPIRTRAFRNEPLSHVLLHRLSKSLEREDTSLQAHLRQKHALESLGIILYCLFEKPCIDFKQQILSMFCQLENAETFFGFMIQKLVSITIAPSTEGEFRSFDVYTRMLALYVALTLISACDNLQRNSILDHFSVNHKKIVQMIDNICRLDYPLRQKEQAFSLLTVLCNHRKHESRNAFGAHLRGMQENDMHIYMFSLREILTNCNHQLVRCTKGTYAGSQDVFTDFMESASETVIAWGAQIGSAFGAWISGVSTSEVATQKNGSQGKDSGSRSASPCPEIHPGDPPLLCDAMVWWHARFLLFTVYEILCGSGGDQWIRVFVEHDVPPWTMENGARGGSLKPLASAQIVLEVLQLISFCIHANSDSASLPTHLGLILIRALVENIQTSALLFSYSLEETQNVSNLQVFERKGATFNGPLSVVSAMQRHHIAKGAEGEPGSPISPREPNSAQTSLHQRRSSGGARILLEKSLAAVVLRQLSCVLLEHCLAVEESQGLNTSPRVDGIDTPGGKPGLGGEGNPSSPRNGKNSRLKGKDGLLSIRVVECFHRLLLFEKRTVPSDKAGLLGIEWGLISKSLFALVKALSLGPTVFPDLDAGKFIWLCAHLGHIVNLILSSDFLTDTERVLFLFEVLNHRIIIEELCRTLENHHLLAPAGGCRVVQNEFANLRTILFHFASVVMMIENPDGASGNKSPSSSKQQTLRNRELIGKMTESAVTLKLKPHDRLRDGFQKYAETGEERYVVRDYLTQLLSDTKALRIFERSIRKKP